MASPEAQKKIIHSTQEYEDSKRQAAFRAATKLGFGGAVGFAIIGGLIGGLTGALIGFGLGVAACVVVVPIWTAMLSE